MSLELLVVPRDSRRLQPGVVAGSASPEARPARSGPGSGSSVAAVVEERLRGEHGGAIGAVGNPGEQKPREQYSGDQCPREVSEEQRDMMKRACGLSVLVAVYGLREVAAQDYSMDLDAPATAGRESALDVALLGTSAAEPPRGVIGLTALIHYDPQAVRLDAHSFAGTVFEDSDFLLVTDDGEGNVRVVVIHDQDGNSPPESPVVPAAVGFPIVNLTFHTGSCTGATNLTFGAGIDDNILVDEDLAGHDVGSDLELNGVTVDLEPTGFIRGNADGDVLDIDDFSASVEMSDGLFVVDYLFLGGDAPPCLDAADANDDGRLNVLDPIWMFQFVIGNDAIGPALPEPFTTLGEDPTEDSLDCQSPPESTPCDSP